MMDQIILTYIVIMATGGVLQLVLAFIGYTNRHVFAGTQTFAWLSLFSAIYAFGHALELTRVRQGKVSCFGLSSNT